MSQIFKPGDRVFLKYPFVNNRNLKVDIVYIIVNVKENAAQLLPANIELLNTYSFTQLIDFQLLELYNY